MTFSSAAVKDGVMIVLLDHTNADQARYFTDAPGGAVYGAWLPAGGGKSQRKHVKQISPTVRLVLWEQSKPHDPYSVQHDPYSVQP